jgi:elongation factor Ts
MVQITASMVKELREITGLGMMECKKALAEADGDMKAAEDLLRIKSGAKAGKVAGRIAAEGAVAAYVSPDGKTAALVEVNCETDFVAKDAYFADFVKTLAQRVVQTNPPSNEALAETKLDSGETVEGARKALVMKLGENIHVRRFARVQASGQVACYLHGNKIGVLVDYQGGDEALGKDLAMHIAASKPLCISKQQVPAEVIAKEREIYKAQAAESGKPANIVEKMVEGKIAKYLAEITLLGQPFVKDSEQTVERLLSAKGAKVNAFHLFVVGEGIKRKSSDFVAEVMVQVGQA